MKKCAFIFCFCCIGLILQAQQPKAIFELISFKRYAIAGVAPTPVIELGGKEISNQKTVPIPSYYIFLKENQKQKFSIDKIWIAKKPYAVRLEKVIKLPYILVNGKINDTLISNAKGNYWQLNIQATRIDSSKNLPSLNTIIKENELVLPIQLNSGKLYLTNNQIKQLQAERRQ